MYIYVYIYYMYICIYVCWALSAGPSADGPPVPRTNGPAAPAHEAGPAPGPGPPIGNRE